MDQGPWKWRGVLSPWYSNFDGFGHFTRWICKKSEGAHLVVRSIGINVERYVVVGVNHEDICSQDCFHDFQRHYPFCESNNSFSSDLSDKQVSKWSYLGHISQYLLIAPRKPCISLKLHGVSCLRMAEIHFLHDLSPIGINHYLSQSKSKSINFLDGPCIFGGFNVEAICFGSRQYFVK